MEDGVGGGTRRTTERAGVGSVHGCDVGLRRSTLVGTTVGRYRRVTDLS